MTSMLLHYHVQKRMHTTRHHRFREVLQPGHATRQSRRQPQPSLASTAKPLAPPARAPNPCNLAGVPSPTTDCHPNMMASKYNIATYQNNSNITKFQTPTLPMVHVFAYCTSTHQVSKATRAHRWEEIGCALLPDQVEAHSRRIR